MLNYKVKNDFIMFLRINRTLQTNFGLSYSYFQLDVIPFYSRRRHIWRREIIASFNVSNQSRAEDDDILLSHLFYENNHISMLYL